MTTTTASKPDIAALCAELKTIQDRLDVEGERIKAAIAAAFPAENINDLHKLIGLNRLVISDARRSGINPGDRLFGVFIGLLQAQGMNPPFGSPNATNSVDTNHANTKLGAELGLVVGQKIRALADENIEQNQKDSTRHNEIVAILNNQSPLAALMKIMSTLNEDAPADDDDDGYTDVAPTVDEVMHDIQAQASDDEDDDSDVGLPGNDADFGDAPVIEGAKDDEGDAAASTLDVLPLNTDDTTDTGNHVG